MSETEKLVAAIEAIVGSGWSQEKRAEVGDLLRAYRFEAVATKVAAIQKLVRESGNVELSTKLHLGKY